MSGQENQTIVAIFDAPEQTPAQYIELNDALAATGAGTPKGRLYHMACAKGTGYLVVDVWESAERLNQFAQILVPTILKLGGIPATPQIYPVIRIAKE